MVAIYLVIFIFACYAFVYTSKAPDEKLKSNKEKGVEYEGDIIHLAGYPYFKENEKIKIVVSSRIIVFKNSLSGVIRTLKPQQIIRCEVKTEREISKDVTFTRLLTLGVFAFAFKKKTIVEEQFLVLSYIDNNIQLDCIFKNAFDTSNFAYKHNTLVNLVNAVNTTRIAVSKQQEYKEFIAE